MSLTHLDLGGCTSLSSLDSLSQLQLRSLKVPLKFHFRKYSDQRNDQAHIEALPAGAWASSLTFLQLQHIHKLTSADSLAQFINLNHLDISMAINPSSHDRWSTTLEHLLFNVVGLAQMRHLTELNLSNRNLISDPDGQYEESMFGRALTEISQLKLRCLHLNGCAGVAYLSALAGTQMYTYMHAYSQW